MKTTIVSCVVALMASAFFGLTGCQSPLPPDALLPVPTQTPAFTGDYVSVAEVDAKPAPLSQTDPVYPPQLFKSGVAGEARVACIVTADGGTDQVQILSATQRAFGDAAVACVKKWRYTPATKDGKPVNCTIEIPISFSLGR